MPTPRVRLETTVSPREIPISEEPFSVTVILHVIAPGIDEGVQARPLNLALVIDKSGSMRGSKIDTAKSAAIRVVEKLNDEDIFTLVSFNNEYDIVVPATRVGSKREAIIQHIRGITPSHQTKLAEALNATLTEIRSHCSSERVSTIYVLTDGIVHDANACLNIVPGIETAGLSLRAGGIGEDYDHAFLDQLCTDPLQKKTKYLVEHIDLDNLTEALTTNFEEFLRNKGHVVTADCRLTVDVPPNRTQIRNARASEHARELNLDENNTVTIADIAAGGEAKYIFTMSVTCKVAGDLRLANFRLNYRLSGQTVTATAPANLAIRHNVQPIHNPDVTDLVMRLIITQLQERAEKALERGDTEVAVKNIRRSTQLLRRTKQLQKAIENEKQADEIEAGEVSPDLMQKQVRESTRRMSM